MLIKRPIYIIFLLLLTVNSNICISQSQSDLETVIEVAHTKKKRSADGKITINITNGSGPYKLYLSKTPALVKEEDILETKNINFRSESTSFENLVKGTYFIISVDKNEKYSIDKVTVEQEQKQ